MVSQAELILRVIALWYLVLSQFFLETVWVPLKDNAKFTVPILVLLQTVVLKLKNAMYST